MKGLILAGGAGTRLRPLTHTGPKQLIPIANKPNILYCLEDLRDAGIKEIGVILGNNMPEKVRELLGDGGSYGVKITYIVQGEPKGIAHAVGCSRDFMKTEPFVVYLGDNILKGGIWKMVDEFMSGNWDAAVALCRVKHPEMFGVAELDERGKIIKLVEKPKQPKSDLALVGIYMFREVIFETIENLKPSWRNELEITDAIDNLVQSDHMVRAHIVEGWWKDTGKPEDILEANHLILDELQPYNKGIVEEGAELRGKVGIGERTVLTKGSVVKGPTIVGMDCRIGPDTYIGPYTAIGDNCTIIGCEIEASIVMNNTVIKCKKKIVDSLIGACCVIEPSENLVPSGHKLVLGENSVVYL